MAELVHNLLIEIQEKYAKVQHLLKQKDPDSEPYRSKYAAAAVLTQLKALLTKTLEDIGQGDHESKVRLTAMLAAVWYNLGTISLDTEALSTSGEELKNATKLVEKDAMNPQTVIVLISSLNQLGVLYSMLEQPERSKDCLEKAEKVYKNFTEVPDAQETIRIEDLFKASPSDSVSPRSKAESELEKSHTLTLYYLAQVYGSLQDTMKSAVYCHNTLKRQLESKDYDPIDWALNSATLSQFFMERNGFKQARHHLAAASYILDKYFEEQLRNMQGSEEEIEEKKEQFKHRSADVARCWAKYGLLLLGFSKDRLMKRAEEENDASDSPTTDLTSQKLLDKTTTSQEDISGLLFSTLEIPTYENQITDRFILDYEDALPVFHSTKQWLEDAKQYYTLEEHASDYVRVTQDCSALFQLLAFFEADEKRQCQMHKRRVDMLEHVVSSLNHQCYLQLCRQLWFELGETYWEMIHLKLGKLQDSDSSSAPDPHVMNKINMLTEKSIIHFGHFIDSICSERENLKKVHLEVDFVRPVLLAHFYRGRLFARIITPDKATQVQNNKKSLESFKFIVDYCSDHPEAAKEVALELSVCKDMVDLLPHKIARLASQMDQMSVT